MHATYAPEQACQAARKRLELQGIRAKAFAIQDGLHSSTVYAVLNGQKKCLCWKPTGLCYSGSRTPSQKLSCRLQGGNHNMISPL
ncbi:hypothetical protein [Pseudomonas asiatica]|uniref:hypothetical protein n=2 Tax=Pseudomonas TaxID=286 RepID=UPI003C7A6D97